MEINCVTSTELEANTKLGQVFIIRHAESGYNEAVKGNDDMKIIAKHDVALLDAPLSKEGHIQCIKG